MAKQKETPLENLGNRLREILKEIEEMFNPQPKRERALVPVPVRVPQRRNTRRSY